MSSSDPLNRYREVKAELDSVWPLAVAEACRRYAVGESVALLATDAGVSTLTVYNWLEGAGVPRRNRGRPKKLKEVQPAPAPVSLDYTFSWTSPTTVTVQWGDKVVEIDRDRIEWTGDPMLGQQLVSGKNAELVAQFEGFVNGND